MFIKLKQKKYYTKILSKKFSGFGIFKFPCHKVLLGVFLMVMIFGGIFGGADNTKAYSEGNCFPTIGECKNARVIHNNDPNMGMNEPLLRCVQEGEQYCLRIGSAADIITGRDITGAIVIPIKEIAIKVITIFLEFLGSIVLGIIYLVCWLILQLVGVFVEIAAWIVHNALNPGLYHNMFGSSIVDKGWVIIRDICNMFFILILLVISLATILRIQTYKAQSLLLPLLIAAFLVNFSRPIVELAIDASQILMYQFVNMLSSTGGSTSDVGSLVTIKENILNSFWNGTEVLKNVFTAQFNEMLGLVVAIMFAIVFLIVLCLVYLAMALYLIIRLVALTILIILSPLGFFFNILPQTKSYASKYWSELSKYLIFGPIMAFFIYLASVLANELTVVKLSQITIGGDRILPLSDMFGDILQYIIVLVFLYSSIWIARQLGIWGADKVQGMTTGKAIAFAGMAGGAIGGAVGGYLGGTAGRAGTWTAQKADSAFGGRLGRAKEYLKTKPGGSAIIVAESKIKAKQRKKTEEYEAMLNPHSSDVVRARGNSITATSEESAASVRILAKRDDLDKVKDKKLFEKAKRGGVDTEAIYTRMPTLAGDKDDKRKELERISEEGKLSQISAKSFEDKDIMDILTKEFSTDKIKTVYKNGTTKQQEAMEEGLKEGFEKESKAFLIDDTKKRKLFAGLTGKVKEAFEVSPGKGTPAGAIVTMEYVGKMKAADVGNVKEKEDLEIISNYLKVGVLDSIRGELSDEQKKIIKVSIQNNKNKKGSPEETFVNNSPGWAV
jgi:hypothetical protein